MEYGLLGSLGQPVYPYKSIGQLGPQSGSLYPYQSIEQLGPKQTIFNEQLPQMPLVQPATAETGLFGLTQSGWNTAANLMGGIGSLGNMYVGLQQLGLLEDQLGLQKQRQAETLKELDTMRKTRSKLNQSYMA